MERECFKTSFARNIFYNKYAFGANDTWDALCERVVEDVCGTRWGTQPKLMSDDERKQLVEYMISMKFIAGGRYLYYAGRPAHYYNNCLSGNTKVLTRQGWRQVSFLGETEVLSPVDGKYYPAKFLSHGKQKLNKITFAPVRGNSSLTWEVKATRQHHWPLIDGSDTYDLRVGDVVPANTFVSGRDLLGFAHGFIFGDGTKKGQLRLCADKDKKYLSELSKIASVTFPPFANGDPMLYFSQKVNWKKVPENNSSPAYIASFIKGWIAADGSETRGNKLCSVNEEALKWFREFAAFAGIVISGELRKQIRNVEIGKYSYQNHTLYIQNYSYGIDWAGFKVVSIKPYGEEEVFCPFEPTHNRIIIDNNIDTFQCYLLRAEEDTREEWSSLTQRAMSCLMTGGGIGAEYSRLRESGASLRRTGGKASGPISLMSVINEVGRNVMQGGTRRSAIYASLNWQHGDIPEFLRAKNWDSQRIGETTLGDLKRTSFNFPCPLDMTNISINYDNKWLLQKNRDTDPTFLENCKQAMSTGEPGFSFNFGDKENETLRNAPLGPDTYVLTSTGYTQIRDLLGEIVYVWTGKQFVPTKFLRTGESVPVVKVSMSGGRQIIADPSHEFFLDSGDKVKAADLQKGDSLMVSLCTEADSFLTKDYYSLGYIYGDGSFNRKYPRAEVTFCTEESKKCFEYFDKKLLTSFIEKDSRGYLRAYTKNNKLFQNRNKEMFPEDLLNKVGTSPQVSFIAGLFDSDGNYIKERGTVRLSSKNKGFLEGVRRVLESLGILSGISTAGVSTYGRNQGYTLTVCTEHTDRFRLIIPTKRLQVEPYKSYRAAKITVVGVEDAGFSDVYCCDVGVKEHAFMAEGVIVSNCTEVTSEDDSDVCNLGSINLGNISSLEEFKAVVILASKFLVCGTLRADLPYRKVYDIREKNRRLGLGLMGIHEWLLKRGEKYEVTDELKKWLEVYKDESERSAKEHCDRFYISHPIAFRAIAPTGTIGILASTTTGIEPLFACAFKRRYLVDGTRWKYEFVVDATADRLIHEYACKPESIDTALKLSENYERRIKFQADVQDFVDMSLSSTINLPRWGSEGNNIDRVEEFAGILAKYAPRLRGFTCYPDGARGGQPLTEVSYAEAKEHRGIVFEEHDICDITGRGGSCGV